MAQKPQYRLQTLLEMREREEKEAKDRLALKRRALAEEQRLLDEMHQYHEQMKADRAARAAEIDQKMSSGEIGVDAYLGAQRYLERLDNEIEEYEAEIRQQDKKVAFAEQEVEWAMTDLTEATQKLKALEKHKEKWEEEVKKELAVKEEMVQDEIAQTVFRFRK